jgi:hypothetical protein
VVGLDEGGNGDEKRNGPDEPTLPNPPHVEPLWRTSPRNACAFADRPECQPGPGQSPAASPAVVGSGDL